MRLILQYVSIRLSHKNNGNRVQTEIYSPQMYRQDGIFPSVPPEKNILSSEKTSLSSGDRTVKPPVLARKEAKKASFYVVKHIFSQTFHIFAALLREKTIKDV